MQKFLFFFFLVGILVSCKKEPTTWNTDWSAPIAHGHLTLEDIIPAENLTTNSDNYISIVYHKPVYTFTIDTIVKLPDTSIVKKSAIGVSNLTVNPGFSFTDDYDQLYALDQIELKKVRVTAGTIEVEVKCPWPGASVVTFTFPKITQNSIPFQRTYTLPAGSLANPAIASEIINIAGHYIDLTGTDGNQINMLSADFLMGSNESANSFTISNTDSIEYVISFKGLKPDYAKGYFGQYYFSDTTGISLDFMKNISGGSINVDSIDLVLTVKNGFNLIAQSTITTVKGMNTKTSSMVDLTFPMIQTSMNINPASGGMYDYIPSEFPIAINSTNSNLAPFVENLSDSIILGYELEINPFGNVTGGSDEVFPGSAFELFLDAEFPLDFGADQLTLVDTFKIDYTTPETVIPDNGVLELIYSNGFPIGADAYFFLLDENDQIIDSIYASSVINSGIYNATTWLTTPASGSLTFNLTSANVLNLDLAKKVVLNISFSTFESDKTKIDASAYFDFVLKSNLQINVSL